MKAHGRSGLHPDDARVLSALINGSDASAGGASNGTVAEGGGWNASTTRAFGFSLLFMFVAGDVIKVLALTFLSASLLPGFLSPHARGLRLVFRALNQAVKFVS